jgi:hypothetical protein
MRRFHFSRATSRRYFAVAAAVSATVLLAALVATHTAAAGITYPPPHNIGLPAFSSNSGEAPCPAGHADVTGGGVEIIGDNSQRSFDVSDTSPASNGWEALAVNASGSAATMRITAICAKSSHLRYPEKTKDIPPHSSRVASKSCPSGTKLIGGGVDAETPDVANAVALTEPHDGPDPNSTPDGWVGAASNFKDGSETMLVDAVCSPNGHYKYVHSARKPLPDNSEVSARAKCPAGTNVTGGGVDNSGGMRVDEVGAEIVDTAPFDTDDDADSHPDDGWAGSAQNVNTGHAETMQVFAICKVPATHFFSGSFTKFDPDEGPATMSFALTHDGKKVHDWTWHHMPVHCAEGDDVNSSHYTGKQDVKVVDHEFIARGVPSDEGFKTTLHGFLTHHNTRAHGTLTMHGPEPPTSTKCHGTDDWHANVQ